MKYWDKVKIKEWFYEWMIWEVIEEYKNTSVVDWKETITYNYLIFFWPKSWYVNKVFWLENLELIK